MRLDRPRTTVDVRRVSEAPALLDRPPREQTLGEELDAYDDDAGPLETVKLREPDTGVAGVLFISTAMASHGPRVKFMLKAGRDQPGFSVSIDSPPGVLANSLPERDLARAAPQVAAWVSLNHEALLRFWNEGDSWDVHQLAAFAASLRKL